MIELSGQEASLVVQAISMVRLSAEFTAEEQLILKQVAERLDGRVPCRDENEIKESDPKSR